MPERSASGNEPLRNAPPMDFDDVEFSDSWLEPWW